MSRRDGFALLRKHDFALYCLALCFCRSLLSQRSYSSLTTLKLNTIFHLQKVLAFQLYFYVSFFLACHYPDMIAHIFIYF